MLATLPIACVQTPAPLSKNRRRAPSPIFTEGRGVCTQAILPTFYLFPYFRGQLLRTSDISNIFPGRLD